MSPSETPERRRRLRALLQDAVDRRIAPAAAAEIGSAHGVLWRDAFGTLTSEAGAVRATDTTIFDLASLTKPIATTSLALGLTVRRTLALEDRVAAHFSEWAGEGRDAVTVQDLLEHASGLPARLLDRPPATRREFEHDICTMPLEYQPRTRSIYSDLGFILLGFLVENRGGLGLAVRFDDLFGSLTSASGLAAADWLAFGVPPERRIATAPTGPLDEDPRRGRLLVGEVHDTYAAALGGAAGHAGLFGTVGAVGAFARLVLRGRAGDSSIPAPLSPDFVARATRPSTVPGSSRALGWDTMRPASSCGPTLSAAAFGHVGFTGTSLWVDPELDRYFVLLTNRVCGGGTSEEMQNLRREFHALAATL